MNARFKHSLSIGNAQISRNRATAVAIAFIYKLVLEYSYVTYLYKSAFLEYTMDFSFVKYINATIWVFAIALAIDVGNKKVSSFILFLHFMIGIIPISIMYSMENDNAIYFNVLCACYFISCIVLNDRNKEESAKTKLSRNNIAIPHFNALLIVFILALTAIAVAYYFAHNGMPKSWILGLDSVYELRATQIVIANKYIGYISDIVVNIGLPALIAYSLVHKKWFICIAWFAVYYVFYVFSGNKTMLFAAPVILAMYYFSRKNEDCTIKVFSIYTAGIAFIVAGVKATGNTLFVWAYSLICRRILFFPADIKFNYYDYFITHPKIGLAGMPIIGGLFTSDTTAIGNIIGDIYYNAATMNANTGFLIEGFQRFGQIGTPIILAVFVIILKLVDSLQERIGYAMALTLSVYIFYSLNDGQLLGSLMTGPMLMLVILTLFFQDEGDELSGKKLQQRVKNN